MNVCVILCIFELMYAMYVNLLGLRFNRIAGKHLFIETGGTAVDGKGGSNDYELDEKTGQMG